MVGTLLPDFRDSVSTPKWPATFFSNHLRFIPLDRSLSRRSLGSSHGVAPQERLFVIDVAFASFSPTKTECQYIKDVPILTRTQPQGHPLNPQIKKPCPPLAGLPYIQSLSRSGLLEPRIETTFQDRLNPYLLKLTLQLGVCGRHRLTLWTGISPCYDRTLSRGNGDKV